MESSGVWSIRKLLICLFVSRTQEQWKGYANKSAGTDRTYCCPDARDRSFDNLLGWLDDSANLAFFKPDTASKLCSLFVPTGTIFGFEVGATTL